MRAYPHASRRQIVRFMQEHCRNDEQRAEIVEHCLVSVEIYERLNPGQSVFSYICGGKQIFDEAIVFKIVDEKEKVLHYAAFPVRLGKKLLREWNLPKPLQWSAYAQEGKRIKNIVQENQELRNLLVFTRMFLIFDEPMPQAQPRGFKEIFEQIHEFPEEKIDGSVVKMVNDVIAKCLRWNEKVLHCANLQDYIAYLHEKYPKVEFADSDFTHLRKLLQDEDPGSECYF